MILLKQRLKYTTSPYVYVLLSIFCYLLTPFTDVHAKTKALIQKSNFQMAYEKAMQSKKFSFDFIDQKGKKRMYVIDKNGAINEIQSKKVNMSQSNFEMAWDFAKKKGLNTFKFTDQKGKIRTYVISKNGTVNEKISFDDKFSSQKRVLKKPSIPRSFSSSDQKTAINDEQKPSGSISKDDDNAIIVAESKQANSIEVEVKKATKNIKINKKKLEKEPYRGVKLSMENLDYTFKVGARYWISEGETEFAHCASVACGGGVSAVGAITGSLGDPTSKLEYTSLRNRTFELIGDLEINNIVLTANLGLRDKDGGSGSFRDFDWITDGASGLPGDGTVFEFSDTISPVNDISLKYSVWDIGYKLNMNDYFKGINVSVTPFLGYVRYNEKAKAYGINDLPDDFGPGAGFLPEFDGVLVLQNEIFWAGQRFGTEIEWGVNPKTNFLANIAYVENMRLRNEDSHMLRQDVLGPAPNVISTGEGRGWMIDLMGNYSYNNNLGFEIGYRFWRFEDRDAVNTNHAIFPLTFPIRQLYSQRQGFMIGAEYTF